ncbi:hypothetical protein G9A89_012450 [Geosiphon pyriformis]|nr:hypothetical protein G9A89_012450 [Geosiphon pyriformis]
MVTGVSGSGSTGLRTHPSTKKKHVDNVYSYSTSYKKLKKSVASSIVDMSTRLLNLANIGGNNGKSVMSWRSEVGKTWIQMALLASSFGGSDPRFFVTDVSIVNKGVSIVHNDLSIDNCLAFLKYSLELLAN